MRAKKTEANNMNNAGKYSLSLSTNVIVPAVEGAETFLFFTTNKTRTARNVLNRAAESQGILRKTFTRL
jgi:hypothetical protein